MVERGNPRTKVRNFAGDTVQAEGVGGELTGRSAVLCFEAIRSSGG